MECGARARACACVCLQGVAHSRTLMRSHPPCFFAPQRMLADNKEMRRQREDSVASPTLSSRDALTDTVSSGIFNQISAAELAPLHPAALSSTPALSSLAHRLSNSMMLDHDGAFDDEDASASHQPSHEPTEQSPGGARSSARESGGRSQHARRGLHL